jgi:hypothetical protein
MSWKSGLGAALSGYTEGLSGFRQGKAQEQENLAKAALEEIRMNLEQDRFQLLKNDDRREEEKWGLEVEKALRSLSGSGGTSAPKSSFVATDKVGNPDFTDYGKLYNAQLTQLFNKYFVTTPGTPKPGEDGYKGDKTVEAWNDEFLSELYAIPGMDKFITESKSASLPVDLPASLGLSSTNPIANYMMDKSIKESQKNPANDAKKRTTPKRDSSVYRADRKVAFDTLADSLNPDPRTGEVNPQPLYDAGFTQEEVKAWW